MRERRFLAFFPVVASNTNLSTSNSAANIQKIRIKTIIVNKKLHHCNRHTADVSTAMRSKCRVLPVSDAKEAVIYHLFRVSKISRSPAAASPLSIFSGRSATAAFHTLLGTLLQPAAALYTRCETLPQRYGSFIHIV
jgi:hypothetical protein